MLQARKMDNVSPLGNENNFDYSGKVWLYVQTKLLSLVDI